MDRAAKQISNLGDQVKEIFQKEGGKRYKIFFILFYKEKIFFKSSVIWKIEVEVLNTIM